MKKKELRQLYREKRNALSAPERNKLDDLMLIQFQTVDLPFLHNVFSFRPIEENNEPNTDIFTSFMEFRNPALNIAYPKLNNEADTMNAIMIHADTAFKTGEFNVEEPIDGELILPEQLDLVLVPLLISDTRGFRVGYGKGYYDKFLAQCRPDCVKVGLSYFEPVDEISDTAEFDVPLDLCITPHNIYVF